MSEPLVIAQISDLHIKRPGELAYRVVDTAAALARCVARLNALRPRPALVVVSGDLVDTGADAEYAHLRELLRPLQLPLAVIPGNHDARDGLRRAFPDQPYAAGEGALNFVHSVGPFDLLCVDSTVPGAPHGLLDPATLAWIDLTLAAAPERPAILVLHHPPFATGIAHMDRQNLHNASGLAAVVGRHPRLGLVAAGHVHRAVVTSFAGRPATICPAPNHAVDLDLAQARVPSLRVEPPAFHLHAWIDQSGSGAVVTHWVPIGDFDGPHPFFDPDGRLL